MCWFSCLKVDPRSSEPDEPVEPKVGKGWLMDEIVFAVADITLGSRQTVLGAVATKAMVSSRILAQKRIWFILKKEEIDMNRMKIYIIFTLEMITGSYNWTQGNPIAL